MLFTVLQTLFLLVNQEIAVGFCMRSREVKKEREKEKNSEKKGGAGRGQGITKGIWPKTAVSQFLHLALYL